MPTIPKCISCRQEMRLLFTSKKVHKTKEGSYKVRKYRCDLCETEEAIYADGFRDFYLDPKRARDDGKELNDQLFTGELTENDKDFLGISDVEEFDQSEDL